MQKKRKSFATATVWLSVITLISTMLGFGRESYIAFGFGATRETDAYFVASVMPTLIAGWIAFTMTNALIPALKAEQRFSRTSAKKLVASMFWNTSSMLILMTIFVFLFRMYILHALAPGFTAKEYRIASSLFVVMLPSVLFSGLTGLLSGVYDAKEDFSVPAWTGIVYNLGLICVTIVLKPMFGIKALAYGYTIGIFGGFLLLAIPILVRSRLSFSFRLWHPAMRPMLASVPPMFLSYGVTTLNTIVDRMLASGIAPGQITDLNFASKLGLLPSSIVGMSVATTLYAQFVTHTLDGEKGELRRVLESALGWVVFIGMIVGTLFLFFANPSIAILFGHGAFLKQDVMATGQLLEIYGIFAVFYLLPPILTRFFYARRSNKFVFVCSSTAVAVNIAGSLLLVHPYKAMGLVFANGLSQVVYVVLLMMSILVTLKWRFAAFLKTVVIHAVSPGILFGLGVFCVAHFWHNENPSAFVEQILRGLCAAIVGAIFVIIYHTARSGAQRIELMVTRLRKKST